MEVTSQFAIPASGATKDFPLNHKRGSDFKVGVGLNLTAGTVSPNIQVQITLDDIRVPFADSWNALCCVAFPILVSLFMVVRVYFHGIGTCVGFLRKQLIRIPRPSNMPKR